MTEDERNEQTCMPMSNSEYSDEESSSDDGKTSVLKDKIKKSLTQKNTTVYSHKVKKQVEPVY